VVDNDNFLPKTVPRRCCCCRPWSALASEGCGQSPGMTLLLAGADLAFGLCKGQCRKPESQNEGLQCIGVVEEVFLLKGVRITVL
jgi:hypothetical protein